MSNPGQTQATGSTSIPLIPQTAPAGGILMTQPPATATSFYKIAPSQVITFGWNMTSVIARPTHLTVSAVCDNGNTYPVGPTDGIIPGDATSVTWDLYSYQVNNPRTPLAQATYTLVIYDERGRNAVRRPGYLQAYEGTKFALYTPQAYTPLADWTCATCGAANSLVSHPMTISIIVTMLIMFLSGFHLLKTSRR